MEEAMCWRCGGTGEVEGWHGMRTCPECDGRGMLRDEDGLREMYADDYDALRDRG